MGRLTHYFFNTIGSRASWWHHHKCCLCTWLFW